MMLLLVVYKHILLVMLVQKLTLQLKVHGPHDPHIAYLSIIRQVCIIRLYIRCKVQFISYNANSFTVGVCYSLKYTI